MPINPNLNKRVVIYTGELDWEPSSSASVWRKRTYLDGHQETGVVTSIVRYNANSIFRAHDHPDGKEYASSTAPSPTSTATIPPGVTC